MQVVTPRSGNGASCPFCKRTNYSAEYTGPLSVQEQQRIQQEEQKAIELQIEQQVREEQAYRDRLASRGVVASPEGSRTNSASTLPTPVASPQLVASAGGMSASPNATSIPVMIPSTSGSESGGTYPSCSASPTADLGSFGPSPSGLQPSPPRLVAPIVVAGSSQGDEGYDVRWLEAQQAQHQQARDGSHTASPPTAPNFAELRGHWSPPPPEPANGSFEAELEDLMLMEAIRLSMLDQQPAASDAASSSAPANADAAGDSDAAAAQPDGPARLTAQLAAQVEHSIRRQAGREDGDDVGSGGVEPFQLPPSMPTADDEPRDGNPAAASSGADAAGSSAATTTPVEEVNDAAAAATEPAAGSSVPEAAVGGESDARRALGASLSAAAGADSSDVAAPSGGALGDRPLAPREAWPESPSVADSGEPATATQPPGDFSVAPMPGEPEAGGLPASASTAPVPVTQADEQRDGSAAAPPLSSSPGAYDSDLQLALALSLSLQAASPAAASPASAPPLDAHATAAPAAVAAAAPAPTEPIAAAALPRPVAAANAAPADD